MNAKVARGSKGGVMMRQGGEGPTSEPFEPFEPLRSIDLKRATRFEPTPQANLGGSARQWWRSVANNMLSLRVQPVLPEIAVRGGVITAIDRGEITARAQRTLVVCVLAGWLPCVITFGLINGVSGFLLVPWGAFAAIFLALLLMLSAWGLWFTRGGSRRTSNTLTIDTTDRTARIHWKRTDGDMETTSALDTLALGLYMVEIYEPELPRNLQRKNPMTIAALLPSNLQNPMTIAALPMETFKLVDRGWIAIALLGDLWVALGIDRAPDALRESLQPLRNAGLAIDDDPAITVRGFGVRTLLRPDRARFSRKR